METQRSIFIYFILVSAFEKTKVEVVVLQTRHIRSRLRHTRPVKSALPGKRRQTRVIICFLFLALKLRHG